MNEDITIIGTPISPYVRKVLAILDMKGLSFRCIPQVPFLGDDNFTKISPMRRIPVMKIGDFTLADSTAIAEYLDEAYPQVPVYPRDAKARARARWFEEYADDHVGRNVIFNLFFQRVVRRAILKETPDEALIEQALTVGLPGVLAYLESQLGDQGFLCGDLVVADLTIAAMFKNAFWSGWSLDTEAYPRFAAYLERVSAIPQLARVNSLADAMMNTPQSEQPKLISDYCSAA